MIFLFAIPMGASFFFLLIYLVRVCSSLPVTEFTGLYAPEQMATPKTISFRCPETCDPSPMHMEQVCNADGSGESATAARAFT